MHETPQAYAKWLDEIAQSGDLEVVARDIVNGFMLGIHRSPYHGFSAEFSQYRPYNTGDDIRRLDWKLLARSEKYYIREYDDETNLRAMLFLDNSPSMQYRGSGPMAKSDYSRYLSAALAYLMQRQKDAVGLALGDQRLRTLLRPSTRSSHLRQLLLALSQSEPVPAESLPGLLQEFARLIERSGMSIVISDFLAPPEELFEALKGLRFYGRNLLLIQILDPMEIDFAYREDARFVDMESGEKMAISPGLVQATMRQGMQEYIRQLGDFAKNSGIEHLLLTTEQSFALPLAVFLRERRRLH
jgi:uncharacterized protein (DUF58 family)